MRMLPLKLALKALQNGQACPESELQRLPRKWGNSVAVLIAAS